MAGKKAGRGLKRAESREKLLKRLERIMFTQKSRVLFI